jgi:hypothetical protein
MVRFTVKCMCAMIMGELCDEWSIKVSDDVTFVGWHTWGSETTWVDGWLRVAGTKGKINIDIGCYGDECCIPEDIRAEATALWESGSVKSFTPFEKSPVALVVPFRVLSTELMREALKRFHP